MNKRILILKACGNADEPQEYNSLCVQTSLYSIDHVCKTMV